MPITSRLVLTILTPALLAGCGRWVAYTPIQVQGSLRDPKLVYSRLMQRSEALGYQIECAEPSRLSFCVRAHLDQHRRRAVIWPSFFQLSVQRDGSVWVSVQGRRVRQGVAIHHKLCAELTAYLDGLVGVLDARPRVVGLVEQ